VFEKPLSRRQLQGFVGLRSTGQLAIKIANRILSKPDRHTPTYIFRANVVRRDLPIKLGSAVVKGWRYMSALREKPFFASILWSHSLREYIDESRRLL
jgi:hypothetical protein